MKILEAFFRLKDNRTTPATELIAGITTFLTMSYIIFVNPMILEKTGMPASGLLTATVLVAALSSIVMGLLANLPFAAAPGMGLNAFLTYTLVLQMGLPWRTALGAVVISGACAFLLTFLNARAIFVESVPTSLRRAIATGIGLFIAFIGLRSGGFIVSNEETLVAFGGFSPELFLFLAGLAVTSLFVVLKIKGALLLGIVTTSTLGFAAGKLDVPTTFFSAPDFSSLLFQADVKSALTIGLVAPIFIMVITDMFDSIASFLGIAQVANLLDKDGNPRNTQEALYADSFASLSAGLFGSSSGTTYIESASGVEAGGRTGLTAVIAGLCFLPFLFLGPLASMIPAYATAPALVLVGVFMFSEISRIDFQKYDEAIPAFLSLILIPLTYSITQGIVWGFISHTILKVGSGRARELHPAMYGIFAISVAIVLIEQ